MVQGEMNIARKEDIVKLINILSEMVVDIWLNKGLKDDEFDNYKVKLYKLKENLK